MKTIPLNRGFVALVDDEVYPLLAQWKWSYNGEYAVRFVRENGRQKTIRMHRLITAAPVGFQVDHVNGNKLDNRRENLCVATNAQNMRNRGKPSNNTSGYKGVSFEPSTGRYQVHVGSNGRQYHVGRYLTAEEAARAYNAAAIRLHGEFAKLNEVPA